MGLVVCLDLGRAVFRPHDVVEQVAERLGEILAFVAGGVRLALVAAGLADLPLLYPVGDQERRAPGHVVEDERLEGPRPQFDRRSPVFLAEPVALALELGRRPRAAVPRYAPGIVLGVHERTRVLGALVPRLALQEAVQGPLGGFQVPAPYEAVGDGGRDILAPRRLAERVIEGVSPLVGHGAIALGLGQVDDDVPGLVVGGVAAAAAGAERQPQPATQRDRLGGDVEDVNEIVKRVIGVINGCLTL